MTEQKQKETKYPEQQDTKVRKVTEKDETQKAPLARSGDRVPGTAFGRKSYQAEVLRFLTRYHFYQLGHLALVDRVPARGILWMRWNMLSIQSSIAWNKQCAAPVGEGPFGAEAAWQSSRI